MSHSSNNYSAGTGLKYVNKRCRCGQKAIVKISESTNNKNKLCYACADGCSGWIGWCLLINEQYVSSSTSEASDSVLLELHELRAELRKFQPMFQPIVDYVGLLKRLILVGLVVL
jgi:hypothetical protein